MITNIFLQLLIGIISILLTPFSLLPDVTLPTEVSSAITNTANYIATLDQFIPAATLLTIIGLIITIELILLGYKLFMWLIKKVPGIS